MGHVMWYLSHALADENIAGMLQYDPIRFAPEQVSVHSDGGFLNPDIPKYGTLSFGINWLHRAYNEATQSCLWSPEGFGYDPAWTYYSKEKTGRNGR